jgi:hypothetical protein
VYVRQRIPRLLPWDWTAYAAVDLLVLYDPDWTALGAAQVQAITEWVASGGRLLMVLGAHPLPAAHPLAKLLPLEVGDPRELRLTPSLLGAMGVALGPAPSVTCWTLGMTRAFGWESESPPDADRPVFARGPAGFGRVGVLAFDPAALGTSGEKDLVALWVRCMHAVLEGRTIEVGKPGDDAGNQFYPHLEDRGAAGANAVLDFLLDIPELEPISIWWVILLLVLLAVVIGPVDYFILKRRGRLPLTWLTFTFYIGAFSVAAYFGVRALRAGPPKVRAVSVVDAVEGHEGAWSCRYTGIYAPESDDYALTGLQPRQWWAPLSPYEGPFMRGGSRRGTRLVTCVQGDGGSLPTSLPISIWSMQCLMAEGRMKRSPIAAEVEVAGDGAQATVTNLASTPAARGYILFGGGRYIPFGAIAAGGQLEVRGQMVRGRKWAQDVSESPRAWFLGIPRQGRFTSESAFFATGVLGRTDAIAALLAKGAAVVCVQYDDAPTDCRLADRRVRSPADPPPRRDQVVSHQQVARLVVMPRKGPKP